MKKETFQYPSLKARIKMNTVSFCRICVYFDCGRYWADRNSAGAGKIDFIPYFLCPDFGCAVRA